MAAIVLGIAGCCLLATASTPSHHYAGVAASAFLHFPPSSSSSSSSSFTPRHYHHHQDSLGMDSSTGSSKSNSISTTTPSSRLLSRHQALLTALGGVVLSPFVFATPSPVLAVTGVELGLMRSYVDSSEQFTIKYPVGWTVSERQGVMAAGE